MVTDQYRLTSHGNPQMNKGCVRCPYSKTRPIHKARAKRPRIRWRRIFSKQY